MTVTNVTSTLKAEDLDRIVENTIKIYEEFPVCKDITEALLRAREVNEEAFSMCCELDMDRFMIVVTMNILHELGIITINSDKLNHGTVN